MSLLTSLYFGRLFRAQKKVRRNVPEARRAFRPDFEVLEHRTLPATNLITNLTELANYTQAGGGGMTFSPPNQATNFSNSTNGATYINTYDSTSLAIGSHFKSVGVIPIGSISVNALPGQNSQTSGTLVAVFALEGVITIIPSISTTVPVSLFEEGAMDFYLAPTGTTPFIQNNLATWGAGTVSGTGANAVFTAATPLAEYILKSNYPNANNEQISQGNPNAYGPFAQGKGTSVVNIAQTPVSSNSSVGSALLRDAGTFSGTTFNPTLDVFSNRTTDGLTSPFTGLFGQVTDFADAFANSSNTNLDITSTGNSGNSANNLIIANGILQNFSTDPGLTLPDGVHLAGTELLAAGGIYFADGFNNAADPKAYTPNYANGSGSATGDFASVTNLSSGIAPTIEPGVDANITISPDAVNPVNKNHTFTVTVQQDDGLVANFNGGSGVVGDPYNGFGPAVGVPVTVTLTDTNGATTTPTTYTGTTDSNGQFQVTFTSPTAGTVIGNATTTVFGDVVRSTGDGHAGDSGPATKNFVDALVSISPLTPVNAINSAETFTATVTAFPGGTGTPSFGTPVVTVSGGLTPTVSGLTINGNTATFTITINSNTAGTFTVTASDAVTMGGVTVTRTTGDGFTSGDGSDSAAAVKNYVDALIGITPLTPVNEVKHAEVFTVTVTAFPGTTGTPSFGTPTVTVSGGLTPTVSGLTISGNTATFTITINSTSAGTFTVTASDAVTMGGVTVTRTTGDGFTSGDGSDSPSAVKNYVDALIGITPLTPVNEVKHAEVFTVTVTAFPAATGTPSFGTPTVTVSGGLTPTVSALTISGNTATFTVTINSTTAGTFTVTASDVVTMGGVAVTRTTGDGFTSPDGSDSASAVKNYVDALIGITPLTPVNEVKHAEVFTVTITAFPAATGTPSLGTPTVTVSGGMTPTVSALTISGNTATFTVTINSTCTAGTFTVTARDVVTMGVRGGDATPGDGFTSPDGSDSASAVKNYVDALIGITPLTPVNEVKHAEVFYRRYCDRLPGAATFGAPSFGTPTVTVSGGFLTPTVSGGLTISGNTATFTVTINSTTAGTFTVTASDVVTMGGVTVTTHHWGWLHQPRWQRQRLGGQELRRCPDRHHAADPG